MPEEAKYEVSVDISVRVRKIGSDMNLEGRSKNATTETDIFEAEYITKVLPQELRHAVAKCFMEAKNAER